MSEEILRRLTTIVAADVAAYSRLIDDNEEATLRALRSHRQELFNPLIDQYGGRIANTAGDSLLLEFPSAVQAVRCAIAIQTGLAERNTDVSQDRRIELRIGINVGDVVAEGDDLLGDGVNIAARLEELTEPGCVYLSRTARDQVRDHIDLKLVDLGETNVKNIARPVRIFKVLSEKEEPAEDSVSANSHSDIQPVIQTSPIEMMPKVAVLPFDNLGKSEDTEGFCDGLSEYLITELSRQAGFDVIARNTMFSYKGKSAQISDVARSLDARFVVEGSIRFSGKRVRITAQLIDSETESHIWAQRYDRNADDVFELQDEVSRAIAIAITMQIAEVERKSGRYFKSTAGTVTELLNKGRNIWYRFDTNSDLEARQIYQQALALEPNNHRIHVSLAWTYAHQYAFVRGNVPGDAATKAMEHAEKAIQLMEQDYTTHQILAIATACNGDMEGALGHIQRALELNPNDTDSMIWQADFLCGLGRHDEATDLAKNTIALNEKHPNWYFWFYGRTLFEAGRFEEALNITKKHTSRNSGNDAFKVLILHALGRVEEAKVHVKRAMELDPNFSTRHYANKYLYPIKSRRDEVRGIYAELGFPE